MQIVPAIAWPIAVAVLLSADGFAQEESESGKGKLAFNTACRTCHSMDRGDNRLGPSLHGVVGSKAGASEGYQYSAALLQSHVVWDAETLDRFIEDPNAVIPGNNMKPYGGISDAELRASIVGYLTEASSEAGASE